MPSTTEEMPANLNKYSRRITQPKSQGASQAMLYATGLTEEDMNKPQVAYSLARYLTLSSCGVSINSYHAYTSALCMTEP